MPDPYFKKTIDYNYQGEKLSFSVGETLFSTFDIDIGTDLLLRTLTYSKPRSILDLGCGYGPLGIALAKKNPESRVLLIDRDLLAIKYAQINIAQNNLANAEARGGVGTEEVSGEEFDLVVSNIPAKIGDTAIEEEFILKVLSLLNPGGVYWFVVISALNRLVPKIASRHNLPIKEIKKRFGHTVYKLEKKLIP